MTQMHSNFIYLNWSQKNQNKYLDFKNDKYSTVTVKSSVGVYKNNYADFIMERNGTYYW